MSVPLISTRLKSAEFNTFDTFCNRRRLSRYELAQIYIREGLERDEHQSTAVTWDEVLKDLREAATKTHAA
jgi:hypothetical protein